MVTTSEISSGQSFLFDIAFKETLEIGTPTPITDVNVEIFGNVSFYHVFPETALTYGNYIKYRPMWNIIPYNRTNNDVAKKKLLYFFIKVLNLHKLPNSNW